MILTERENMTVDIEAKIASLEEQLKKLKEVIDLVSVKEEPHPVFKRGYAYKNGHGKEFGIVYTTPVHPGDEMPLVGLGLHSGKVSYFTPRGFYAECEPPSRDDLIHSTERLWDPSIVVPPNVPPTQFKVGWVYQDRQKENWVLITCIKKDNSCQPLFGYTMGGAPQCVSWTKDGYYLRPDSETPYDLILSTGMPSYEWRKLHG